MTRLATMHLRSLRLLGCLMVILSGFAVGGARAAAAPAEIRASDYGKSIASIQIEGLKRIEKDAVLAKLTSQAGKKLTPESARADIKAIHGMGFFEDVALFAEDAEGGSIALTVVLKELPVIAQIEFTGNERLPTDELKETIKLKEWSILDINKVKEDIAALQKHYEEKGYYLARISHSVQPIKGDEVKLTFKIEDFDKIEIKRITFLNNKRFSDRQLRNVLQETREGGTFSGGGASSSFKEAGFKQDLQRLTYWYLEHGYIKFKHEAPVITVSEDKRWLFISIYLDEGEQYSMGTTDFSGDLLFEKEELGKELQLTQGSRFSISQRNADIQKLTEKYQDLGYAFVNVIPKMAIHDETKTVDIDYSFEKGSLVYFGEISVTGNTKTRDYVVRRELKIVEGELYSGTRLRQSRENVERLGFFAPGEVLFNTNPRKDHPEIVDVEISIKERSTGTITLGAGYGTVQKFFFTTQVSEINLAGKGQSVSLAANYSADRVSRSINLGFTDPYAFDTTWSAGFDLFAINFPIPNRYLTRKLGFDLRSGHPIGEYTQFYVTYKNEGLRITEVKDPEIDVTSDRGVLSSVVLSLVRDLRNNRFETTAGNYQSASIEAAGIAMLGGDKSFYKLSLNNRYYRKLVGDLVFRNSIEFGDLLEAGGRQVPNAERYFLGGPNNLKGYEFFSVGPNKVTTSGARVPLGGTVQMLGLFELEYPLIKEAGLKTVAFYDAGNSFAGFPGVGDEPFTLRTDAGFGLRWFSPIGPLRFEWGFPIKPRPGESSTVFQFFIGPPF